MNVAVGPTRDHFEKQFLQVMERAAASRDNLGEEGWGGSQGEGLSQDLTRGFPLERNWCIPPSLTEERIGFPSSFSAVGAWKVVSEGKRSSRTYGHGIGDHGC